MQVCRPGAAGDTVPLKGLDLHMMSQDFHKMGILGLY